MSLSVFDSSTLSFDIWHCLALMRVPLVLLTEPLLIKANFFFVIKAHDH